MVEKALDGKLWNFCLECILQKLLQYCVVDTSAKVGILGDINSFSFAGDDSHYYSGASHYGVKTCDYRSKGIFNCSCPRRFSDPGVKLDWDSYREQWFFGNTLYGITATDGPYDLPIYLKIIQASRHEITPFIPLDSRTKKKLTYPDPAIQCFGNKGRPICPGGIRLQIGATQNLKELSSAVGLPIRVRSHLKSINALNRPMDLLFILNRIMI